MRLSVTGLILPYITKESMLSVYKLSFLTHFGTMRDLLPFSGRKANCKQVFYFFMFSRILHLNHVNGKITINK